MKQLIDFFTRQSLFGILLSLFTIIVGLVALSLIRREVFPNVNYDTIAVNTAFPGAAPEETERLITNLLEKEIKEMDGIKKIESHSVSNLSVVILQLDPDDTTEDEAKSDLRDIVDRVKPDLPEQAEEPVITSFESKQQPIIEVGILSGTLNELQLRDVAKKVQNELELIDGVARVEPFGLRDLEYRVETDLKKLARYQLSIEDLVTALQKQNLSIPGGPIEANLVIDPNDTEKIVRTSGQFSNIDDVKNTVVRANDLARAVRVGDLAKVSVELERPSELSHINGDPAIRLQVLKKERADAITVVDAVKAKVEELQPKLGEAVAIEFLNDLSYLIRRRLKILGTNLLVGLGLVLIVLSLLMPLRVAMIVSIGIPFSFFGTMVIFNAYDNSLNLISMIGLIIVSGMLVDDAIVIVDNCVQKLEEGLPPVEAAIKGAQQIWIPVTAAVMTTIVAFLPMAFMTGIFGKFVKQIPIGVIIALLFSLIEAFFILPGHVAKWVRINKAKKKTTRFERFWETRFVPGYLGLLKTSIRHRYIVLGTVFFVFLGTAGFAVLKMRKVLFPSDGIETFILRGKTDVGTNLQRTEDLFRPIEEAIDTLPKEELKNYFSLVGMHIDNNQFPSRGTEYVQAVVYLTPPTSRDRSDDEIIEDVRAKIGDPEGFRTWGFSRINPGPPVGKPVSIGVRADTYEQIMPAVNELKDIIGKIEGTKDIQDTYVLGKEEYRVKVNAAEAAAAGISVAEVGNTVRAAFEGIIATKVRKLDEEISVRVSLSKAERSQQDTLKNLMIPNRLGNRIPLSRIATLEKTQSLAEYSHEANLRQIKVTAEIDDNVTTSQQANDELREILPELNAKYPGVTIAFGGEDKDTAESMASLGRAFGVAVLGVLLLLVLTFQRLLQPFLLIVCVTIPLGIMAIIWAFLLHGKPLTFMGMLGMVALSGVIVNNAIVFIDFVNKMREGGQSPEESLIAAAKQRIRPIVLTTLTTAVGLLPTTYGIGGLDPFVVYITMALSWGLIFGSTLIAFVLPTAFSVLDDVSNFINRKKAPQLKDVV